MKRILFSCFIGLLFTRCATYELQSVNEKKVIENSSEKHSFFLIGGIGDSKKTNQEEYLRTLNNIVNESNDKSTLLVLGNSISSISSDKKKSEKVIQNQLKTQIDVLSKFRGKVIYLAGSNEWSSDMDALQTIEDYVNEGLGKNSFLPENGCPIEDIKINDAITLIMVDSEWYFADWDKHPKINDNCTIRDRESFFSEIESLVKKNVGKTILFAVHHPMYSNGNGGGQYSFGQSMTPLPVLGTIKNVFKKTGGFNTNSLQNSAYRSFRKRMVTLAQYNDKVIFLSGHEQNLQYLEQNNVHQIISGSLVKATPVRNRKGGQFAYGANGYSRLDVASNGSSQVSFFTAAENKMVYQNQIFKANKDASLPDYDTNFPKEITASVYDSTAIDKSGFHKWFWGERYRKYYGTQVSAPIVNLDTLFGGLRVVRKGGGHQSKSLRLKNNQGKEYVMRALKKSAEAYLQAMVAKEEFIIGKTEGLAPNRILTDYYTGDHPYAPFTIGTLSDAVGIYHTNPVLYYIPKQNALGEYNDEFGNQLFMIEERATDGHGDQKSFGYSNKLISTPDLIEKISSDEKYTVDKEAYIKARLFDMLIGDWDRHNDQWRWAEFKGKKSGDKVYRPVPRDRDQAYSIMGDGFLMGLATRSIPALRLMEGFDDKIRNVKGFNSSSKTFSLDTYILPETTLEQWIIQAEFIQQNIDERIIDSALSQFPIEVQDGTVKEIKRKLLSRKDALREIALEYYQIINKRAVIVGTNKDDYFQIEDIGNGFTRITGYRIKNGGKDDVFFKREFDKKVTKEIWIYGLDDDDYFEVKASKDIGPKIRLIGGQNNDIYDIGQRRKTIIYDYKTQKNTFKTENGKKHLTNNYNINTYDPFKAKQSNNLIIPSIGSNPDDGFKISISDTYTYKGFLQEPFTSQHKFNAAFYFATSGYDFSYKGEFVRVLGKASLTIDAKYTSPNFSINFFGFGNETENFDDNLDLDFNRVKIEVLKFAPSLLWRGRYGSTFRLGVSFEDIKVEETEGRFIEDFYAANPNLDNKNSFLGADAAYSYKNTDNIAFPTLGFDFSLLGGYKINTAEGGKGYGYIIPKLSMDYKVIPSGALVLATKISGQITIGNDFQFYQGASIGAENGLRGYRFQRFTGKSSFYQNTDLRLAIKNVRTSVIPLVLGAYGGFDYGRVWLSNDDSNTWNTSYGGGLFVNASDLISARVGIFNSDDGIRFSFGFGFGF
ncbi:phosphoesterase [uncultured Aquimarina sp.]|uniref:phosphoesterase n=1 Tax=uncultured Aquimarina sp. TaxID=575652 RepID=UPI0026102CFE|nr:phosphoesterase [uncultured Aquimarina sp.]